MSIYIVKRFVNTYYNTSKVDLSKICFHHAIIFFTIQ